MHCVMITAFSVENGSDGKPSAFIFNISPSVTKVCTRSMFGVIWTPLLEMMLIHFSIIFSLKNELNTPMYDTNDEPNKQSPAMLSLSDLSLITSSFHLLLLLASKPMNFSAVLSLSISSACSRSTFSLFAFDSSNSAWSFLCVPETASNLASSSSFFFIAAAAVSAAFCERSSKGCTMRYFSL